MPLPLTGDLDLDLDGSAATTSKLSWNLGAGVSYARKHG
jgi:hypothetical protein